MIIVIAAGDGTRWGNHLGSPKHLIDIDGERLLDRTTRVFSEYDDIIVVGRDERYETPNSTLYVPRLTPAFHEADRFMSSSHLWSTTERTIILYGDVWYSDKASSTIIPQTRDWTFYGRTQASQITGTPHGEIFALSFMPGHQTWIMEHLHRIIILRLNGSIDRNAGWELYRSLSGLSLRRHQVRDHWVEIDDLTEDFDSPDDYERWIKSFRS